MCVDALAKKGCNKKFYIVYNEVHICQVHVGHG